MNSVECMCMLPPFPGTLSLPQGHRVTGRGRSHCWSAPESYAQARVFHGSDPSQYDILTVIFDWSPITIKGTPLQAHLSRNAELWGGNKKQGWVRGGMTQEKGGIDWGEGGGGTICASEALLFSSLKNMRPLNLKNFPHLVLFLACCNYYALVIRSYLKDWQSMKKVHPCAAQLCISNLLNRKINDCSLTH